jgi:hypothetical protein
MAIFNADNNLQFESNHPQTEMGETMETMEEVL